VLQLQTDAFLHHLILEDGGCRGRYAGPCRRTAPGLPGSALAKNGRISRKAARIGSVDLQQFEADGIPVGVIGGGSGAGIGGGSAHLMEVWLTDCEYPFTSPRPSRPSPEACASLTASTSPRKRAGRG